MKKPFLLFFCLAMATANTFSQTEKFDIATFIPPAGWERTDSNGTLAFFHSKTDNGLTSFCQIVLYPSSKSTGTASKNFKNAWQNLVTVPIKSTAKPATQTEKTPDGWTVVTGAANVSFQGINYNSLVANITGFGKTMSVQVNLAGNDYTAIIDKFFNDLNLDSKASPAINRPNNNPNVVSGSMNDYDFIAPEGWAVQNNREHIQIQNMQSGCVIRILQPQASSGDLEQDARAVFQLMYKGWQYQQSGERQYVLSKGFLPKGLEFCMMEATMSATNEDRYTLEDGAALVVKAGNQIVIISVRHTGLLAHTDCLRKYQTWRRFFNSFTVKNTTIPKKETGDAERIIGSWSMSESGASGEYVFAANGNYALYGAIASTSTSRDYNYEYLHIRTYSFQGDGSYSIAGNQLTLKKKSYPTPERIRFRFEKVNHGGTGWKERIYMLTNGSVGENEVGYEKRVK